MQFRVSPQSLENYSAEEWQARVDLAAAHRLAFNQGFSEGIFNHLTFAVPGRSDRYYQIPFGTHWSEVTASCFMEVGIDDGEVKRGEGEVERSFIRSRIVATDSVLGLRRLRGLKSKLRRGSKVANPTARIPATVSTSRRRRIRNRSSGAIQ